MSGLCLEEHLWFGEVAQASIGDTDTAEDRLSIITTWPAVAFDTMVICEEHLMLSV